MTNPNVSIAVSTQSVPELDPPAGPGGRDSERTVEHKTGACQDEHSPERDQRFALLHQANLAFHASLELVEVLRNILSFMMNAIPATGASLWLLEAESGGMVCYQALGAGTKGLEGCRLEWDMDLLKQVIESSQAIVITGSHSMPALQRLPFGQRPPQVRSLLCAPLLDGATSTAPSHPGLPVQSAAVEDSAAGIILLSSETIHAFSDEDRSLLEALAASASSAIGNAQLYERARREIGERIRTEQALRESENRYRTLIETSPDGILVTNLTGIIMLCNSRALELYSYHDKSSLIGTYLPSLVAPEMRLRADEYLRRVGRGEPTRCIELTHMRSDGTTFDGEFVASLIAGSNGEAAGIVGFVEDITARKDAERAIQHHNRELVTLNTVATQISQIQDIEQLLATALDRSLEALEVDTGWIATCSEDHTRSARPQRVMVERGSLHDRALSPLKAEMQAWLEDQVYATRSPVLASTEDFAAAKEVPDLRCQIVGVPLRVGDRVDGILAIVGWDHGHPRPLRVQQVQLLTAIGNQISIALENARLSASAAEVDMLRELDTMRSDLLAGFSHDLRSPLGIITMTCSTLLREEVQLDKETHDDLVADIQVQSARLLHLVEGILDLGQLQNGHLALRREVFDLGELIRRTGHTIQKLADRHRLAYALPQHPLWVLGDANRIEQVLYNLLDNAIKYTPGGGEILLHAEKQQHRVAVRVIDQGIGLAAEDLGLVFERFYRVRSEATKHIGGAGLGLATCKGIVEAHGGRIWAESDSGQGTTFIFTMPAAPELTGIAGLHT